MAFDIKKIPEIEALVAKNTVEDFNKQLGELRADVREMAAGLRTIKPRTATSMAIIASDGGNNQLVFNPFEAQFVRVVDSCGEEICMDVVSPLMNPKGLSERQFDSDGRPATALGRMMKDLGKTELGGGQGLSWMIPKDLGEPAAKDADPESDERDKRKKSWTLVYRDLCEWAALYDRIMNTTLVTDTLFVRDGLLRAKIFSQGVFARLRGMLEARMREVREKRRRKVFLVGLAKKSKVVERYSMAIGLEEVFPEGSPSYLRVPPHLEEKAYEWPEYARGKGKGEAAGCLFLVRFGSRTSDPIWPIDVFASHEMEAEEILGCLLEDAKAGFPIPFYPLSLQRADGFAQVRDLDLEILQAAVVRGIRDALNQVERKRFDEGLLISDTSSRRY